MLTMSRKMSALPLQQGGVYILFGLRTQITPQKSVVSAWCLTEVLGVF